MAERTKTYLKQEFRDGERPSGTDFGDFIDSYINKTDDQVSVDVNQNLNIPGGVNLGNPTLGNTGTLRFNSGNVQFFNGTNWINVGGASGAFIPVAGGPSVAFNGGNVGIGNFGAAPTFRLEVPLGDNTGPGERVKFGNGVIANGQGAFQSEARFSHASQSDGAVNNFALRQGTAGDVHLNAPTNQSITISHNRTTARVFIAPTTGVVVIGNNAILPGSTAAHLLQVNGDSGKIAGGNVWAVLSDVRYKKDIRPFEDGLEKLLEVKPVWFKYDGLTNANTDQDEVGVIGQEIQEVFPYMTSPGSISGNSKENGDALMYNGNALTYVMVNAIQELALRVQELETRLDKIEKKNS